MGPYNKEFPWMVASLTTGRNCPTLLLPAGSAQTVGTFGLTALLCRARLAAKLTNTTLRPALNKKTAEDIQIAEFM